MLAKLIAMLRYFEEAVPFRLVPALVTTAVLVILLLVPTPEGLKPNAWTLVAIFLTTIVAIILKVMPIGVMALMAIVIVSLAQVTSNSSKDAVADALSSFDSPLIWLIVAAVLISRGLKKTGLGSRLGLIFISMLGKRTIGIGYGLAICDLLLAPFTPSNTARGGGIVHPIMKSISSSFQSDPETGTEGKVGTYLALVNYHANTISSGMFITATAPNPLVVDYVAKATNMKLQLSWTDWALCMLVPGLLCMLLMPALIYLLSPPQLKATPDAIGYARSALERMGPVSPKEKVMIGTFALLLLLWANVPAMIFGNALTLDPTVVAFVGLFILIITGTIDWDDVLSEKSAWDTLIWFGALVMLAEQLNKLGVIKWFSEGMKDMIVASGMGWGAIAAVLALALVYSHYLFASTTAHISAMFLAFVTVGAQLIPPEYLAPFMLMMVASSTIMMTLTHYATGTSPIVFGSGYVTLGNWWRVGFVMSVVELIIYAVVGVAWWKVLGYW
ncbi:MULTISPECIES: DASS family sodium-coupled anion symporter [Ramlibacter]|uniref:DASS family sodium-coupled anion symporter n=1 Tax=Ramlibacter pinisoli TaxID=2682844 RepID=A0A6N8IY98_9BURK|nr:MULTISPECIES: DASS family sodium-coupled anion symporter [Ramlibacter]MBA2961807.1 DASS family sodium-coupled anion symporter [Ramlibacter sp. CGMCC 1.13660]MVQ31748.1 DASS family sodium-coupled anion symporter [Ramlibacter pinisoli]